MSDDGLVSFIVRPIIHPPAFALLLTLVFAEDLISLLHQQRRGGVSISAFNRDVEAVRDTRGRRDRVTTRSFSGIRQGAADTKSKRSQAGVDASHTRQIPLSFKLGSLILMPCRVGRSRA